jgi:flagellar assembly protein FliH
LSKIIKANFVLEKRQNILKRIGSDMSTVNDRDSREDLTQETANALYYETKLMLEDLITKAQQKADDIILKAKEDAQNTIEQASLKCQEIKEDAHNSGYNQGYLKGVEQSSDDIGLQYKGLVSLIKEFDDERKSYFSKQEEEMIELVFALTEKILGTIIDARPEVVNRIIKNTLEHVKGAQKVTVKVNPIHIPYLNDYNDIFKDYNPENIQIVEDYNIKPGDCQVVTENGFLDSLLDVQLLELKQALLEVVDHD